MKITTRISVILLFLPLYMAAQCPARPKSSLILTDNDICFGSSITAKNNSEENGNDVRYLWEWGDGTYDYVEDKRDMTHKYDQPINFCATPAGRGLNFRITLSVINKRPACASHSSTSDVYIYATPQTDFTMEEACVGDPLVKFKDATCPIPNRADDQYLWDFGDPQSGANNTSTIPNPTHLYPTLGSYTVTLTVKTFCGTQTKVKQVRVLNPPQARVDLPNQPVLCAPYDLTLKNNSLNGTGYKWTVTPDTGWAFINSSDTASFEPTIRFNKTGDYKISLSVLSPCKLESKWESGVIQVRTKPKISLDTISGVCIPFVFKPKATLINDGGAPPQYLWTFNNNGQISNATNFDPGTITFPNGGQSSVEFKATNGCGESRETHSFTLAGTLNISFPNIKTTLCNSDSLIQLKGTPAGGVWKGTGITNTGFFSPKTMGIGEYTFNYGIAQGSCRDSQNLTVKVVGTKVLAGEEQAICINSKNALILRGGTPMGGVWTGSGVIDSISGIFDPKLARAGSIPLTYTYREPTSGCPNSDIKNITVHAAPKSVIDTALNGFCANAAKTFTHRSQGAVDFKWLFGDGDSSSLETPIRAYANSGEYDLYLIVKNFQNCYDTTVRKINVLNAPNVSFAVNKKEGCTPLNIILNNTTQGNNTTFFWDFGNGVTSTQRQPNAITFINPNNRDTTYTITLSANVAGCSNIKDSTTITVVSPPKAAFGLDVEKGCSPLSVRFNNLSTGSPRTYFWDFRNGRTTNEVLPPNQIFTTDSTTKEYNIKLVVGNVCKSDSIERKITVNTSLLRPLFSIDKDRGCEPLAVNFTNYSPQGIAVTYDFGDGNRYTNPNPSYIFEKAGIYNVTQYATGICGADSVKKTITVFPTPSAQFTYKQFDSCHDYRVQFKSTISQNVNIVWDFGDSTQNGQNNPIHNYKKTGQFKTILKVQGIGTTCSAVDSTIVEVKPPLKFKIDSIIDSKCYGVNSGAIVIRRGDVTGGALKYEFSLNDSTFQEPNTTGLFSNLKGRQYYSVWVRDTAGCTDSVQVFINGRLPLEIDAGPMKEVELGDSVLVFVQGNVRERLKVKWDPEVGVSCPTCEQVFLKPKVSTIYKIDATDAFGCTERTFLNIVVNKTVKIFVPNTFSPNDDGFNDVFAPHTGLSVQKINYLKIFNRWGEMVYESTNFDPNDRNVFWDGRHRGKPLMPQVLIYIMEVKLADGEIALVKGDITLVK